MRPSTGTCSASLLPPTKLYLGNPVHLTAGGGNPGRNRGVKSNDPKVMEAVPRAARGFGNFAGARQLVDPLSGGRPPPRTLRRRVRAVGYGADKITLLL